MSPDTPAQPVWKNTRLLFSIGGLTVLVLLILLWPAPGKAPGQQSESAREPAADSPPMTDHAMHGAATSSADTTDHSAHAPAMSHDSMADHSAHTPATSGDAMTDHSAHAHPMQSPVAGASGGLLPGATGPVWSCSMHPQIQRDGPGACPICGMDLIPVPVSNPADARGPRELTVSASQRALMKIETVAVERRFPVAEIRMVGKLAYDETRLSFITAWVPGRIDELFVDYTGVRVREGDHMVSLYSPELLSAQEELLQARQGQLELSQSNVESLRRAAVGTVESARDKLRLWGLNPTQITEIEATGQAAEKVTIYSPASGVVIDRNVREGMYVETGTRIFTIADLDAMWLLLDAYEADLSWLRYGQHVRFRTAAYPGEEFEGLIAFIDPVLNAETRTVKVRVNVDNQDGRLKPEMFVRATVYAQFAAGGRVVDDSLAGKWVSPMHPEIIRDAPGFCDVCGMALVPAASLGYSPVASVDAQAPLLIPASAALLTGTRAVVYVELPDRDRPTYEGREVELGPRAGDDYVVVSGLAEGERVVVAGNFKIDSALQIQARPSMMNPDGGAQPGAGHQHGGA